MLGTQRLSPLLQAPPPRCRQRRCTAAAGAGRGSRRGPGRAGRGGTGLSFAFLVLLAQLVRYDWRLDEAAMVFGARPWRCFFEVMLPNVWPAVLGAFLVSFILAFNNFEISFYNLGAIPTLPTIAWGTLRHGIEPELYALASVVNALVFFTLIVLYLLIRLGFIRLGVREA